MAMDAWSADADRVADQPQALHMTPTVDWDVARLESFSDAVFGFVATLLVVSIDVPNDFRQLLDRLAGFPGFLVGILVLTLFWARHRAYFRRLGHRDRERHTALAVDAARAGSLVAQTRVTIHIGVEPAYFSVGVSGFRLATGVRLRQRSRVRQSVHTRSINRCQRLT